MRRAGDIPLPLHVHVPGSGSVPDMGPLELGKAYAPSLTTACGWQDNLAYLYGHDLLDAGFNWEAHEVWEVVWLAAPANSAERVLLQALIQLANARLKLSMGRENACRRLLDQVEDLRQDLVARLGGAAQPFMGVNTASIF